MNKEQIEEMGVDICKGCNSRLDPTFECNRNVCTMAEIVSKYLIDIGWTKQIWHKVADGDLPENNQEIRWIDKTGEHYNGTFHTNIKTLSGYVQMFSSDIGCNFYKDEVIAWIGLPIYKEN